MLTGTFNYKANRQGRQRIPPNIIMNLTVLQFEPRREKTGLRDFRLGPTQTGLYSHRR